MEQKKLYVKYMDFVDGIRLFVPIGAGDLP